MNKDGGLSHKLHGLDHLRAFAIMFVFFFHYALSPKCFLYKYESKITAKIAALSYGIYLIHKIIIHVTQTQFSKINIINDSNIMLLICVVTVFIISLLLNEIIEKPFLKLRKKILSRKKTEKNKTSEAVIA